MNSINWTPGAAKQVRKLDAQMQRPIRDAVSLLEAMPNCQNVKSLTDHSFGYRAIGLSGYRLRVGNYRVLFDWQAEIRIVDIQEVRKRDERTYSYPDDQWARWETDACGSPIR